MADLQLRGAEASGEYRQSMVLWGRSGTLKRREVPRCQSQKAGSLPQKNASLGRSKEEALAAARPLPPHDEMVIEGLTDEEERIFVEAIFNA